MTVTPVGRRLLRLKVRNAQLASWAGMYPGQRDSAGKHRSGKTRKGSKWLRAALVQSARAASRTKGTYLSER
jgi:transposase